MSDAPLTIYQVEDGGDIYFIVAASADRAIEVGKDDCSLGDENEVVASAMDRAKSFTLSSGDDYIEVAPPQAVLRRDDGGNIVQATATVGEWADFCGDGALVAVQE